MKKYKTNIIKTRYCYSPKEICSLMGVSRTTVRNWIRSGLPTLSQSMVMGSALKTFLLDKNASLKKPSQPGEWFCFGCKKNVKPLMGSVSEHVRNRIGHTKRLIEKNGTCPNCQITMYQFGSCADIQLIGQDSEYAKKETRHFELPLFQVQRKAKGL